jgi:hypothetical protein
VQPQDVNVVGTQSLQRCLKRLHQALAVIASGIEVAVADVERVLGADREVISLGGQQVAEDRFGGAVGVLVGRVDEGASGLGEQLELLGAFALRRAPAPVGPRRSWCPGRLR